LAVLTVLGEAKVVVDKKDHTIFIDDEFKNANGAPKHFREIGPMLFRDVDGQGKLAFVKDPNGRLIMYIDYPFMLFHKIENTFDKTGVNYVILGFSLGVIGLTLLLWPVAAILRRHHGKPLPLDPRARRMRLILHLVGALDILFAIGFVAAFSALGRPGGPDASGDLALHLLQVIGVLGGIDSLFAIFAAAVSWGDKKQWVWYPI
jgi:hypothetical protein